MDDIYSLVLNLGLSTGIAIYLIRWITVQLNSKISDLVDSIKDLKNSIDMLREEIIRRGVK